MSFHSLERRWGWLSFPGFLRYYALMSVLVFVVRFIRPEIGSLLDFDRAKVFSGEIWRVVTCFFAVAQSGRPGMVAILFLACAVSFAFMISDGLEGAWGTFKTSVFCYAGMGLITVANFVFPYPVASSCLTFSGAAFLAFATLFPKVEILFLFFLPVQVRVLAWVQAAFMVLAVLGSWVMLPFFLLGYANYLIWAGIPALRGTARVMDASRRKRGFNAAKKQESEAFHTCVSCNRTDVTDPGLEFRVGADGLEYCVEHLVKK